MSESDFVIFRDFFSNFLFPCKTKRKTRTKPKPPNSPSTRQARFNFVSSS